MRITVFTRPVYQLEDQASIVEELLEAAGERGVRIQTLLLDRGFYTTTP
jgi:DNA mismatch repair protein MutH